MWSRILLPTISLLSLAIGVGGPPPRPNGPDPRKVVSAENAAERKLEQVLPEVRFDAVPLEQAIRQLSELAGVNMVVDHRVLDNAGIDPQKPITIRMKDVSTRMVLTGL